MQVHAAGFRFRGARVRVDRVRLRRPLFQLASDVSSGDNTRATRWVAITSHSGAFTMSWWLWAALGFLLAAVEIATPGGFFFIFFGLASLVVALLAFVGLAGALSFQILLFSVFSVVSLLLFRNPLLRWMARHTPKTVEVDSFVGEIAVASTAIPPGGVGQLQLRGSAWNARNGSQTAIEAGGRCRVLRVEGLVVWIEPE
jgi:membrane protein implicated in regulation of membrane protease activity